MAMDVERIEELGRGLDASARRSVDQLVEAIVEAHGGGGRVVVVTGSGPNIHEGVTTLLAELIHKGVVHGVSTSSAVVAHEMAGSLDRVKRVSGAALGVDAQTLPKGQLFEVTLMDGAELDAVRREMRVNDELIRQALALPGEVIIKAAGNLGYPMGLRTEKIAREVEALAHEKGLPFELVAGLGADPRTMIGAGALRGVPVLVSVPQLIGGGMVGLCIGDSIPLKERSLAIANMLRDAQVIIESGVALTQEIHDGPFETYTGHGMWSAWEGGRTFSLRGKTLARIDLDPNLERVWQIERGGGKVQQSIDQGLPKTKTFKVPFRMEMSGFARLEGSIPIIGDLGVVWPIIAARVSRRLGISLDFISYPQETDEGRKMRNWIVDTVAILDRERMLHGLESVPHGSRANAAGALP
jgi:hypothetical protein